MSGGTSFDDTAQLFWGRLKGLSASELVELAYQVGAINKKRRDRLETPNAVDSLTSRQLARLRDSSFARFSEQLSKAIVVFKEDVFADRTSKLLGGNETDTAAFGRFARDVATEFANRRRPSPTGNPTGGDQPEQKKREAEAYSGGGDQPIGQDELTNDASGAAASAGSIKNNITQAEKTATPNAPGGQPSQSGQDRNLDAQYHGWFSWLWKRPAAEFDELIRNPAKFNELAKSASSSTTEAEAKLGMAEFERWSRAEGMVDGVPGTLEAFLARPETYDILQEVYQADATSLSGLVRRNGLTAVKYGVGALAVYLAANGLVTQLDGVDAESVWQAFFEFAGQGFGIPGAFNYIQGLVTPSALFHAGVTVASNELDAMRRGSASPLGKGFTFIDNAVKKIAHVAVVPWAKGVIEKHESPSFLWTRFSPEDRRAAAVQIARESTELLPESQRATVYEASLRASIELLVTKPDELLNELIRSFTGQAPSNPRTYEDQRDAIDADMTGKRGTLAGDRGDPQQAVPRNRAGIPTATQGGRLADTKIVYDPITGVPRRESNVDKRRGADNDDSMYTTSFELRAFLPIAGSNEVSESNNDIEKKKLDFALFDFRPYGDPLGDAEENELVAMNQAQDGLRYLGGADVLPQLLKGSDLNGPIYPYGTISRPMPPNSLLAAVAHQRTMQKAIRNKFVTPSAGQHGSNASLDRELAIAQRDPRWILQAEGVKNPRQSMSDLNTMPVDTMDWVKDRGEEVDDDEFMPDLFPAQAASVPSQLGFGETVVSSIVPHSFFTDKTTRYNPFMNQYQ